MVKKKIDYSKLLRHSNSGMVKLSDSIEELTILWFKWLENDKILRNTALSSSVRRGAGEQCELLIKRRYEIIEDINSHFDKGNDDN